MEHLVKFWLEAESFHSTTWSRIRAHSLNTVKQSSLAEPVSPSKKPETTAAFVTESLNRRLEDSGSAQLEGIDLNNRTSNSQNHLLSQESDSAHSLHLETARTGTHRGSLETQESSRLTVASRSSPSSPLKALSGKLMKSKCVVCLSLSCFCFYNLFRGFPGGPVAKIAETKCRGPGSDPWLRSSRSLPHATIRSVAAK